MTEKIIATAIILLGATMLTFARRWNNEASDAGVGVAGWAIFTVFIIWMDWQ